MAYAHVKIDQINILLMLLSVGIAYILPFELVLFSYAFLGPAHYLTQISWMHDRDYFTGYKRVWIPAMLCTFLLVATAFMIAPDSGLLETANFAIYALTLAGAAALVFIGTVRQKIIVAALILLILLTFGGAVPAFAGGVSILLPTVIHIYVFTGAFILLGALKNASLWGGISFAVFVACGASFFFLTPSYTMLDEAFVANNISMFEEVGNYLADLFSFGGWIDGTAMLGFLSFAYTYHYLNWFSKVEIIKWHDIPRKRLAVLVLLYLISISVYVIDYMSGFLLLLF